MSNPVTLDRLPELCWPINLSLHGTPGNSWQLSAMFLADLKTFLDQISGVLWEAIFLKWLKEACPKYASFLAVSDGPYWYGNATHHC